MGGPRQRWNRVDDRTKLIFCGLHWNSTEVSQAVPTRNGILAGEPGDFSSGLVRYKFARSLLDLAITLDDRPRPSH
jgi:hypothetical protein